MEAILATVLWWIIRSRRTSPRTSPFDGPDVYSASRRSSLAIRLAMDTTHPRTNSQQMA